MQLLKDVYYSEERIPEKTLDIYLPDGETRAILFYMNGGGLENGKKEEPRQEGEYLAEKGYAFVSADYRMYPHAVYPDFINDAAEAVAFTKRKLRELTGCDKIYVGGSSAGAYLSMMLCFDKRYYAAVGLRPFDIAGYFHDAGQPTKHFKVLKNSGIDPRRVIVDETAPLYHVGTEESYPPMRFIVSDNDMTCRYEQTMLMMKTLSHFGFCRYDHRVMHGTHCHYLHTPEADGLSTAAHLMEDFLNEVDSL